MPVTFTPVSSPVGELVLAATDSGITGVYFPTSRHGPAPLERQDWVEDDGRSPASALLAQARRQLEEYFAGARTTFDLPLSPAGTLFQRRVWDALRAIPYGTTLSYSELARRLGDLRATRAVGAANGRRSEEHTSELQSQSNLVCRRLLGKTSKRSDARSRCNAKI